MLELSCMYSCPLKCVVCIDNVPCKSVSRCLWWGELVWSCSCPSNRSWVARMGSQTTFLCLAEQCRYAWDHSERQNFAGWQWRQAWIYDRSRRGPEWPWACWSRSPSRPRGDETDLRDESKGHQSSPCETISERNCIREGTDRYQIFHIISNIKPQKMYLYASIDNRCVWLC